MVISKKPVRKLVAKLIERYLLHLVFLISVPRGARRSGNPQTAGFSICPRDGTRCRRLFSWSSATAQRVVKAPFAFCVSASLSLGFPACDDRALCAVAIEKLEPAAATGWSSLQANNTENTMDNKPTFLERIRALRAAAETVTLEVSYMEGGNRRFRERKAAREKRKASR